MSGDSLRSTPVTNVAYLTLNGNFGNNNNDAQLTFRPLNKDLAPVSGNYYSLATNQTTDPSLRINRWSSTGQLIGYGFLYDTILNPPPSIRTVVAGGYGPTTIIYSLDNGSTWLPSSSPFLSECASIAFNGSMWVAGGGNTLLYSGDGVTWTASPNATSVIVDASGNGSVLGLAANGSLWVAAATTGLFYSYDGIYWNATTTTATYFAVAWNGSLWVATGQQVGSIPFLYSYDGITWNSPPFVSGSIFTTGLSVAWNGSEWLAGGQDSLGNTLAYSYDGIHWTAQSCVLTVVAAIGWSAGLWLVGGLSETDTLLYGNDGRTWTPVPDSKTLLTQCAAITWTGTVWLAGGQGTDTIIRSFDGLNWLSANNDALLLNGCLALTVNNVLPNAPLSGTPPSLLLGGSSGIAYSSDGITWESIRSFQIGTCFALLWNGSLWLGGFPYLSNSLGYSYDGLNWNVSPNGSLALSDGCYAFATDGRITLAGGAGTHRMIYSSNGRDWVTIPSADSLFNDNVCRTIGYNGAQWIAGSDSSDNRLIYTSDPSGTWNASASGNTLFTGCFSVAWNGAIWVAVGDTIAFSSNGIGWTESATIPSTSYFWTTVAYNGSLWVAGTRGTTPIAYSYDGDIWRAATIPTSIDQCQSVTWTGSLWIAATGNSPDNTASAAYSYNGITWFASPDSKSVISNGNTVAAKRLNPTDGVYLPPPVLNPVAATQPGKVVYSTGLNNLYVSSIFSVNDVSGTVQIQGDLSANTIHTPTLYVTSNIIANDLSLNTIQVITMTGSNIIASDLSVNTIEVITLTGSNISVEDISVSTVNVWTDLSANTIHVYDLTTSNMLANTISVDTLTVFTSIFANDMSLNTIEVNTITSAYIDTQDILTNLMTVNNDLFATSIYVTDISASNTISVNTLNADTLNVNTINSVNILTADITTDRMSVIEDLSASTIYVNDIYGTVVNADTLYAYVFEPLSISTEYLLANRISATDISAVNLDAENLYVSGIIAPTITAETLNAGIILATGSSLPIGTLVNESAIIITDDRTTIQNVDLSGTVYIGQGSGYGQLVLASFGTEDNPAAAIYANAYDSSGQLNLSANYDSTGIILRPGQTQISNAYITESGLLIQYGAIGNSTNNANAIVIRTDRTMVQNADLSGAVYIGDGQINGNLFLQGGTAEYPTSYIYPNSIDNSGELVLRGNATSSTGIVITPAETQINIARIRTSGLLIDNGAIGNQPENPNAIVISDTRTMVQNADLSGTVYIGDGDVWGNLVLQGGTAEYPTCTIYPNAIGNSGELVLLGNVTSSARIVITPAETQINNARIRTSGLLIDNGAIGNSITNPNAIVMSDTGTIIQNPDLSGTVYIGHGNRLNSLKITGGDVSGTIQSFNTLRPTVAISGEVLIGSSTANQNAIRITDTATTLKNVSFLGGLLLGNNGTIGSTTSNVNAIVVSDNSGTIFQYRGDSSGTISIGNPSSGALQLTSSSSVSTIRPTVASAGRLTIGSSVANPNAIVISDTSGTIIQNRGDSSGTISIGNPSSGALQLTGSSSGTTIRPTVASAGRLSIGSSTANPNAIVVTDTSGTIFQNRGDSSGTIFIGNPVNPTLGRGALQITGGDISGVAYPSFATMRPNVSVSGCLVLGSSTRNPDAITITDTATTINNFSFSPSNTIINTTSSGSYDVLPGQTTIDYQGTLIIDIYPQTTGRYIIFFHNTGFAGGGQCTLNIYPEPASGAPATPAITNQVMSDGQSFTFDIISGTRLDSGSIQYSGLQLINGLGGDYTPPTPAYALPRYY